ncbi:type 4a pilus biogenesis protein PilO [Aliikangiella coralliicola]|nr:type 4a pilus biogenesis protein PilO [Aliikangiella coralliicola]
MANKLTELTEKYDKLPIRLRLLLVFSSIVILVFIVDLLWFSPVQTETKNLQGLIDQVDKQINETLESQNLLNAAISNQRNHPKRKQLGQIKQQIEQAKQTLEERTINLVKPEAMATVLKEIINRSEKLTLLSLVKQPALPLFVDENDAQADDSIQMYRHPLEMVFEGKYSDTQNFLKQIENMPQKVNFESLQYTVQTHPVSKVTLVVSTLSLERKWIGG